MVRALLIFGLAAAIGTWGPSADAARPDGFQPARVVSMNACTDYLALLLAAPGQLQSITWLGRDPWLNPAAAQAQGMHINRGSVEDVLPLQPDLILAGTTTTRQTVHLLRRLSIPVIEVPYATSLDTAQANIRQVAATLGRDAVGEALIRTLEQSLVSLEDRLEGSAVIYGAGGRVAGSDVLSAAVTRHTGLNNLGDRFGPFGGSMSVEELLLTRPNAIIFSPHRPDRPSLAQATLAHPALRARSGTRVSVMHPALWTCEGPALADSAAQLVLDHAP